MSHPRIKHSHENVPFGKRVPRVKELAIKNWLNLHMRPQEIWRYHCNKDNEPKDRTISYEDVSRIARRHKLIVRPGKEEFDRIQGALRSNSVRAFNLDNQGEDWQKDKFAPDVRQKWIPSKTDLILRIRGVYTYAVLRLGFQQWHFTNKVLKMS